MTLHAEFLDRPLAHRGLHDRDAGVIENSAAAFRAAAAAGYGIELDVQISRDGVPMVFHDDTLDRLTALRGPVNARDAGELRATTLTGGEDTILPLREILEGIGPDVPVLVEIKAQAGGDLSLALETGEICRAEADRTGARLAVMSFDPAAVLALEGHAPSIALGLTTGAYEDTLADLPEPNRRARSEGRAFRAPMSFVSHDHARLDRPEVARLKREGAAILCWTIRSEQEAERALRFADQITFEGYRP